MQEEQIDVGGWRQLPTSVPAERHHRAGGEVVPGSGSEILGNHAAGAAHDDVHEVTPSLRDLASPEAESMALQEVVGLDRKEGAERANAFRRLGRHGVQPLFRVPPQSVLVDPHGSKVRAVRRVRCPAHRRGYFNVKVLLTPRTSVALDLPDGSKARSPSLITHAAVMSTSETAKPYPTSPYSPLKSCPKVPNVA